MGAAAVQIPNGGSGVGRIWVLKFLNTAPAPQNRKRLHRYDRSSEGGRIFCAHVRGSDINSVPLHNFAVAKTSVSGPSKELQFCLQKHKDKNTRQAKDWALEENNLRHRCNRCNQPASSWPFNWDRDLASTPQGKNLPSSRGCSVARQAVAVARDSATNMPMPSNERGIWAPF